MEERRQINRVDYPAKSIIVVCDTQEQIFVETENVSPLGMGVHMPAGTPDIVGKDIIIVTDTLIMYADVLRQEKLVDGTFSAGIKARKFSEDVLQFLFQKLSIGVGVNE